MTLPLPVDLPPMIGGHRLVRMLARDERAVTVLVHAGGRPHVARVFELAADPAAVEGELAVHDLLATAPAALRQHVVALDDLFTLPDGRLVALLESVPGCRLDELLRPSGIALTAGEAVTVLAPLLGAVAAGHSLGLTGLPLRPTAIGFTPAGAPIIIEPGEARVSPPLPARYRVAEPAYRADCAAVRALTVAVTHALPPADVERLLRSLDTTNVETDSSASGTALFDLAVPEPLRLEERSAAARAELVGSTTALPLAMPADPPPVPSPTADPPRAEAHLGAAQGRFSGTVGELLRALAVPEGIGRPVESALRAAEAWLDTHRRFAGRTDSASRPQPVPRSAGRRPVRPRFVIAGAAGAAALLGALVLAQIPGDLAASRTPEDATIVDAAQEAAVAEVVDGSAAAVTAGDAPERLRQPAADEWPEIVTALVTRWGSCRAEDRPAVAACAERVVHAGSSAEALITFDDDRHIALAAWVRDGGDAVVVERMGGAVLIDLVAPEPGGTTTASLLVMRSEAGWRVRDVLD